MHKGERAYTLAPLTGGKPRENVYPDEKARAYCHDHPGDPSLYPRTLADVFPGDGGRAT